MTAEPTVLKLIKGRYTVKSYQDRPVPEDQLEVILEAGMNAPSKQDKFPYRMYVLTKNEKSQAMRERLYQATACETNMAGRVVTQYLNEIKMAPVSVLVTLKPESEFWEHDQANVRDVTLRSTRDAMMPVIFMLLQAQEFGLGTSCTGCFADGMVNFDEFKKDFGLSQGETPCIILSFGYAEEITKESKPGRVPRQILDDGTIRYDEDCVFIEDDRPERGVTSVNNWGPREKNRPEDILTRF